MDHLPVRQIPVIISKRNWVNFYLYVKIRLKVNKCNAKAIEFHCLKITEIRILKKQKSKNLILARVSDDIITKVALGYKV